MLSARRRDAPQWDRIEYNYDPATQEVTAETAAQRDRVLHRSDTPRTDAPLPGVQQKCINVYTDLWCLHSPYISYIEENYTTFKYITRTPDAAVAAILKRLDDMHRHGPRGPHRSSNRPPTQRTAEAVYEQLLNVLQDPHTRPRRSAQHLYEDPYRG